MATKITAEQIEQLQANCGQPVPLEDERGNVVCYLLGASDFDNQSSEYNRRLAELLQEGEDSPRIEADQAHKRMRQSIQRISDKYA